MPAKKKDDWADRRTSHRLQVALALIVRGHDVHGVAFEDATSSYDVSREGASFLSTREMAMGQQLELIIPRRPLGREGGSQADFETTGDVRRIRRQGPGQWEIGVLFTGPRLRTYIPETT